MFDRVTLEVSLKPFKKTDDEYIRSVCEKIFSQWRPLVKDCKTISVMMWTADGSEILDYAGKEEDAFEWCSWIGQAQLPFVQGGDLDINTHLKKYLYTENPPVMTYGILKKIVATIKEVGKKHFPGAVITVGETFDIGPEFAISDFKYNRHKEITEGSSSCDRFGFVDCTALLHADNRLYAAYPSGIPEGTPIGEFLGRQANVFLKDMGYDYIWLSNGFGFSADPWSLSGKVFDGERFDITKLTETRAKVFEFWKQFRNGCPDFPVEVRGTNNSVGIDYATDAVPLYEIYNGGFNITPPPNSPWAALNDNYGLEIMGHMTRVCELPSDEFLFRFYIHDPWWINSPWYDRYDGFASDVYLPLAVSRIKEDGRVQTAANLNLLSIDNSYGDMPDACANEPIPHLLKAKKDAGDAPAPLVWVYPMREYSTASGEQTVYDMYFGDRYIMDAINNGFPLNCVVSSDNFLKLDKKLFSKSILISPIQVNGELQKNLEDYAENGGKVIFYGEKARLDGICDSAQKVDFRGEPSKIREALKAFGMDISFIRKTDKKPPTMTIARSNNALFFSVYSVDTTADTLMEFPLGAPILLGGETELKDGKAVYRFSRCEHRECRFFVKQKNGVISAHEGTREVEKYRRKIKLTGLQDAEVYYFPETYCAETAVAGPNVSLWENGGKPTIIDGQFKPFYSEEFGHCLKAEHLTGDFNFYMPFEKYM